MNRQVHVFFLVFMLVVTVICGFAGKAAADTSAGLSGHYYLDGVREVGSELLLHPDGRYQWRLAYGASDYHSEGSWSLVQGLVILKADSVKKEKPLFGLEKRDPVKPWNADAEALLQAYLFRQKKERVLERCPFLDTSDYANTPRLWQELSRADLEKEARAALALLNSAKVDLEKAAELAVKASVAVLTKQEDPKAEEWKSTLMVRAVAAMDRYQSAWVAVKESHLAAGWPVPARPKLLLPPECTMPAEASVDTDKPDSWSGGWAVVVGDAEAGLKFSAIKVEFVFSDGHREKRITGRNGSAVIGLRPAAALQKIILGPTDGSYGGETIVIPPDNGSAKGSIYLIHLDSKSLDKPFFNEMELTVSENRLYSPLLGGSYSKK